jgi:L-alanine-DL-glutamate epimerase-like enolase superfamily enzyme
MDNPRIVSIEWGVLVGQRPRSAGCNARLPDHGPTQRDPVARIRLEDGSSGFGYSRCTREQASILLGRPLDELISVTDGVTIPGLPLEFPLWDALGQRLNQPVYALAATYRGGSVAGPLMAPCYDTSLYFDDLHLAADDEAAALIADEARQGWAAGHRAFKIKVGRGALHMPLVAGTARDIAVIRAVRDAVGPDAPLMIDANNGWNVNLVKEVLAATADCHLFWLEEPFHEDPELYRRLREWMQAEGLKVLIADGEGLAAPPLLDWAQAGLVQVIQYDLRDIGLTAWLKTARQLDAWGVRSAPHNYGSNYGNYASCHLAGAITHFTFVEWDAAATPGLDGSAYQLVEGRVQVPDAPGFGLLLDDAVFAQAVQQGGYHLTL